MGVVIDQTCINMVRLERPEPNLMYFKWGVTWTHGNLIHFKWGSRVNRHSEIKYHENNYKSTLYFRWRQFFSFTANKNAVNKFETEFPKDVSLKFTTVLARIKRCTRKNRQTQIESWTFYINIFFIAVCVFWWLVDFSFLVRSLPTFSYQLLMKRYQNNFPVIIWDAFTARLLSEKGFFVSIRYFFCSKALRHWSSKASRKCKISLRAWVKVPRCEFSLFV